MDRDQREYLRRILKPGVALVKDPRYPEPFLVNVPLLRLDKNVSDDEVLERLYGRVDDLYSGEDACRVKAAIRLRQGRAADAAGLLTPPDKRGDRPTSDTSQPSPSRPTASEERLGVSGELLALDPDAVKLLRFWLNRPHPFHSMNFLLAEVGIKSGSTKNRVKKCLIRNAFIREHWLQKGRTKVSIPEPLPKAYEFVGLQQPRFKGKGGYLSQWVVHNVCQEAAKHGYKAKVEDFLPNGKAVDIVLQKEGETIFVEVVMSAPVEKELTNCVKDLDSPMVPDRLVFACRDSKMRDALVRLLETDPDVNHSRCPIQVVLAWDFLTTSLGGAA